MIKSLLRRSVVVLVTVGVLAALLWYGNLHKVLILVGQFRPIYILWFVFLMSAHEALRGLLWVILIQALGIRVPVRSQIFAFAAGEAAKFIPTGAYLQNYLLQRSTGTDFGESSSATTVIILAEIGSAGVGVVLLGVGDWSFWLRVSIGIVGLGLVLLGRAFLLASRVPSAPAWMRRNRRTRALLESLQHFRLGAASLVQPPVVRLTLLLSLLYVLLAGFALYIVILGLGISGVSFWQAVGVSCFGLAFYVVLGSLEAADVGVLVGLGVSKTDAVTAIFVNRGLGIGITAFLAGVTMIVLHDEWQALRRPAPRLAPAARTQNTEPARTPGSM
jgi:uncharacterized membrane protein YbhN (UPF0104 family)